MKHLIERFYDEIWGLQDFAVAHEILSADFRFRGSLGSETTGVPAFLAYVQSILAALGDYRCVIEELIATGDRAAARMIFTGMHRGPLYGVAATGRRITWAGAAFFGIAGGRITSLWVLGDVEGLRRQLGANSVAPF